MRCISLRYPRTRRWAAAAFLVAFLLVPSDSQGDVVLARIGDGASAILRNGTRLLLQCQLPEGDGAKGFLKEYLAKESNWTMYRGLQSVAIPYEQLRPEVHRRLLLAVFQHDHVDSTGWTHYVLFGGEQDQETLWTLSAWLTGKGSNYEAVMAYNKLAKEQHKLHRGQRIVFPANLLRDVMKKPVAPRVPPPTAEDAAPPPELTQEPEPAAQLVPNNPLVFKEDGKGSYAEYRLQDGQALYTDVVARFTDTDVQDSSAMLKACKEIQKRSGIKNERSIAADAKIRIPLDMLSAAFHPVGSQKRKEYQELLDTAGRLRGQVKSKDLEGVVVVLDPGHGGSDQGAETVNRSFTLFEDELNYDIVCRIKRLLETQTRAKVYVTMRDRSQQHLLTTKSAFTRDADEDLLTTPIYVNRDSKTSATLRAYLANSIYRKERQAGVDERKIVFTSVHCDSLHQSMRGAMIYIPSAAGRSSQEPRKLLSKYKPYREVQEQPYAKTSLSERRRDEALSRNFAETLLTELGRKRIKRHDRSAPIRSVIRRNGSVYVPAVLRINLIPTKVLVETANMANHTDCSRLADPEWRQWFAEAYVNALKAHFNGA